MAITMPLAGELDRFAPLVPTIQVPPTKVAEGTYVIHQVQEALGEPLFVYLNSMVIVGEEPVIVDTGTPSNRERWLDDVFSLVEPEDVRWVFLSHDDVDHSGNVNALMAACPNATLVLNWFMTERMGGSLEVSPARWRWVGDGDSFAVGDRSLHAVRPQI